MKDLDRTFRLQADPSATLSWRVVPERNLLELCRQASAHQTDSVCLTRQLEPRLMKLLCLLAAANGQVLTRDELMCALWPRVVVNENSLTRAVSELRKALNPEPLAPAAGAHGLIETVPKRGYRLDTNILPMAPGSIPVAVMTGSSPVAAGRPIQQRPAAWAVLAVAMSLSAVVSSVWTQHWTDPAGGIPASRLIAGSAISPDTHSAPAVVPPAPTTLGDRVISDPLVLPEGLQWRESVHLDHDSGQEDALNTSAAVVAPDGRFMAFVEEFPGQSQLRLRSLVDTGDAWTVFSSHAPITHLQWSPLDAGLLFTVQDTVLATPAVLSNGTAPDTASASRLARLMLLDLESMEIRELYRRAIPEAASDKEIYTGGSGNLT